MNQTDNTVSVSETNPAPISVSTIIKPNRQEFYKDVVLNAAGEVVDESVWKPLATDVKSGRALAGKLRRNGMQIVHLFDKPGFEKAKSEYRQASKQAKITERDTLIITAFQKAGVPVEPHIERALKDLLPVLSCATTAKAGIVLKNVVKTVAQGAGLKTDQIDPEPATA